MKISPNIGVTLIDYPGKVAFEIYTVGCNYRCPTCHSKSLADCPGISGEEAIKLMKEYKNRDWINGLVVCGGEPTLHSDLPDFLRSLKKELGLPIKLDTNGSQYNSLAELIDKKLVDYVALDIKGSPQSYRRVIGFANESEFDIREGIEKAINVVQNAPQYEFRTTVVPTLDILSACSRLKPQMPEVLRWMNVSEATDMTEWLARLIPADREKVRWYIQKFVARKKADDAMMSDTFAQENLPRDYHETPLKLLEAVRDEVRKKFPSCEIR